MKTNRQANGTIEDQKREKINFIVKLRKLLCIFGQSFRLSSINCRYYWAIAFIIFIESFSSSSLFLFSFYFWPSFIQSRLHRWLWFLYACSCSLVISQLKDDRSRHSITQHTVYERIYIKYSNEMGDFRI